MTERVAALKQAVEQTEHCRATPVASARVTERWEGTTAWDGVVEIFKLEDHPTAHRAYAWRRWRGDSENDWDYTVVLGIPPVNSPQDAVKAYIASVYRSQ